MWKALELPKHSNKLSLKELEASLSELEAKKSFQWQSFTKYLRLTLALMWNSEIAHYGKKLISNINKIFIFALELGTRLSHQKKTWKNHQKVKTSKKSENMKMIVGTKF